jgi:hypothetical protein
MERNEMANRRSLRLQFWMESALAAATAILSVVTLISREWIEILFGVDPDNASGLLEWAIVVSLATATVAFSILVRAEWRRAASNTHPGLSR